MPDYLVKIPQIKWGAAFANTLNLGYPLDNPVSYRARREGSEVDQGPSGVRDSWNLGEDYFLEGDARWIPGSNGTTPEGNSITGWDGATGWDAFLAWARDQNTVRWIPDKGVPGTYVTVYLVEPLDGAPASEDDGTRRIHLRIVNSAAAAIEGYTYTP